MISPSNPKEISEVDLGWVRAQFPALSQRVGGRPAIYFDAPGGTQVPRIVIEAVSDYLVHSNANTSGVFATSRRSDELISAARAKIADFLGCESEEIIFGQNMTTLTFALSRAIGCNLRPGDEIVTTALDHDANVAPWRALEDRGVRIQTVSFKAEDCTLDLEDFTKKLSPRTKLVAVGYASNAVGTIHPIRKIVDMAHAVRSLVFVDAVHYAAHGAIDVRTLDCDFLTCSTYKFCGPHVGVLYGKREHLLRLKPFKVRPASDTLPDRWETGTQNHEGLAGVGACIEYLEQVGRAAVPDVKGRRAAIVAAFDWIRHYESGLIAPLIRGLLGIPCLRLYGIQDLNRLKERTPTIAFRIDGHSPVELAKLLAKKAIFAWHGNFYALGLTEGLGVEQSGGLLRIGLVHYNTVDEVDCLLNALEEFMAK